MQSDQSGSQNHPQDPQSTARIADVKARAPNDAAKLLAEYPASVIAATLIELNPGFAQSILVELPGGLIDAVMHAVGPELAQQWQRNRTYPENSVGRLMEPAYAVFQPGMTVSQTIERLRSLIKLAFITYGYVIEEDGKLGG